jgi:hypothetical protein
MSSEEQAEGRPRATQKNEKFYHAITIDVCTSYLRR